MKYRCYSLMRVLCDVGASVLQGKRLGYQAMSFCSLFETYFLQFLNHKCHVFLINLV